MLPSPDEFLDMVEKMRNGQKQYFKTRSKEDLIESKRLEKEVDRAIEDLHRNKAQKILYNKLTSIF